MDNIRFYCSYCGQHLEVPDTYAGREASCPKCKGVFPIPSAAESSFAAAFQPLKPTLYAGFWKRFCAVFIDGIILIIGGFIAGGLVGSVLGGIMGAAGVDMDIIRATGSVGGFIIGTVLRWLYFTIFEASSAQATLGKMALGIRVTDLNGNRISFGRANGRHWGKIISAIILLVGFLMVAFTEKKQGLHDIMAGCLVVNK